MVPAPHRPTPTPMHRPAHPIAVEITCHAHHARGEAFIERVCRLGGNVSADVLLDDGRDARAHLRAADWEWLELRVGDIVLKPPKAAASVSG